MSICLDGSRLTCYEIASNTFRYYLNSSKGVVPSSSEGVDTMSSEGVDTMSSEGVETMSSEGVDMMLT